MSAAPLPTRQYPQAISPSSLDSFRNQDWLRIGVGASLLTGSLLLLTGKRKAGLIVTAAGTALAILEHKEIVADWWEQLPRHLEKAQQMLEQTQQTIDDLSRKRDQVMSMFGK